MKIDHMNEIFLLDINYENYIIQERKIEDRF